MDRANWPPPYLAAAANEPLPDGQQKWANYTPQLQESGDLLSIRFREPTALQFATLAAPTESILLSPAS